MRCVPILVAIGLSFVAATHAQTPAQAPAQPPPQVTVIRAGRLLDPEAGTVRTNQTIIVEGRASGRLARTSRRRRARR